MDNAPRCQKRPVERLSDSITFRDALIVTARHPRRVRLASAENTIKSPATLRVTRARILPIISSFRRVRLECSRVVVPGATESASFRHVRLRPPHLLLKQITCNLKATSLQLALYCNSVAPPLPSGLRNRQAVWLSVTSNRAVAVAGIWFATLA